MKSLEHFTISKMFRALFSIYFLYIILIYGRRFPGTWFHRKAVSLYFLSKRKAEQKCRLLIENNSFLLCLLNKKHSFTPYSSSASDAIYHPQVSLLTQSSQSNTESIPPSLVKMADQLSK